MGLKALAKKVVPQTLHPAALAYARIVGFAKGRVTSGPFAGMIHQTDPSDFIEAGMLLGTYEKELHPTIEAWLASPPAAFIDVGASQGYYSIGLARRAPQARNIAFEMHDERIRQLQRTAEANGVQVEVWGECNADRLLEALDAVADAAVIVDVEGYEMVLLDGSVLERMRGCRAIIETHDDFVPGVTDALIRRFAPTHHVEVVQMRPRTREDLPFRLCDRWTLRAIDEGRTSDEQKWLVLTPLNS